MVSDWFLMMRNRWPIDLGKMVTMSLKMKVIMQGLNPSVRSLTTCILAFMVLITGCGVTFGYRHADWLIRWQVDHYLDLDSTQRRELTTRLQALLQRHRAEALPQYEQFLKEVQLRVDRGLTAEDPDWIYVSYDRLRADLFERVAPEGGALLTTVTDKQIRNFEEVLRNEEQKATRRLQKPAKARLDERARTMLSLAEDWLGPLSAEQTLRIRQWSVALPDTQPAWWQYRRHRHQELLTLMRHRPPVGEMTQALRAMFVSPERSAPQIYLDTVKDLRAGLTTMLLGMDRILTPVQRRKAIATIQKLIDDVHSLRTG